MDPSVTDPLVQMYINQLNEKERLALEIAREFLESSFSIEKSNGFLKWRQEQEHSPKPTGTTS